MSILGPSGGGTLPSGQLSFLIQNLESEVLLRCENRTTDTSRADVWIRDALLEISGNSDYRDDFPELEEFGPQQNLTIQQQEYAEISFMPTGDVMIVGADLLIWVDFPLNSVRRKLDVTSYQKTDRFTPIFSLPTEWYRFGSNIGFNPIPDKTYQVQMRVVKMHPINDNQLNQTTILLPRDWNEVIVWAAVQRGFMEFMEYEKAEKVHTLLYGDPDNKANPGLIYHIKRKRRKEMYRMESRLTLVRRPSMFGVR